MNNILVCPPFQNVGANLTAICDLFPVVGGKTLEGILLTLGGTAFTRAHITAWRLKANGKIIRESTGTTTNTINLYYGLTTAATQLQIDFMNRKAKTPLSFGVGAMDLSANSGIKQLTLEVDIGGATAPTLSAHAEVSPIRVLPDEMASRFVFRRQTRAVIPVTGAQEHSILIPHMAPSAGGSVFEAIHLFHTNITSIRARRNGIDEFGNIAVTPLQQLQGYAGRSVQSGHLCFDPCLDGIIPGRVWDTTSRSPRDPQRPGAGCNSAEFLVTVSGSDTITVETQELIFLNDY